ncbi:type II secretion system minor pseudopilin GspK [Marilutibacter aestuarii]|uniref:Type II secretion system protein K n=1 Tax=Marilutibacter aestuarii TaxID=1706195 RepID=A0A508AMI2_9GAMM|nr:type II secretion system minor pseudopilin GspK [Lysobacter aestuarii]TQD51136.1 general secretion pathway protein GspK [Lysobacter aestuarii]
MNRARRGRPSVQRGVALLTVLLLVAVMSVLVVSMLDDIRFATRRARNVQSVTQAQWHALGAGALARQTILRLDAAQPGRTTLAGGWNGRTVPFPIEDGEGGMATLRIRDAGNCFNLNSVVEGAVEQWQRRELGARQYSALLHALDFDDAQATQLVDALVDWIDSDATPSSAGAEDAHYAHREPASRTSGSLLADTSELRAIAGYSASAYARLRPYVCALPDAGLSPLNLNTLGPDDGPLLSMLTLGALDAAQARRTIAGRPAGGWEDPAAFWSQPLLAAAAPPNPVLEQVALRTRFFGVRARVEYGDAQVVLDELLELRAGTLLLRARQWNPDP